MALRLLFLCQREAKTRLFQPSPRCFYAPNFPAESGKVNPLIEREHISPPTSEPARRALFGEDKPSGLGLSLSPVD